MRVADQQVYSSLVNSYQQARLKTLQLQEQLASGKQISKPSDDPGLFNRIVGENETLSMLAQSLKNIQTSTARVNLADASLQDATNTITRIRELAVQFASNTYGATDRSNGAQEVQGLLQHLLQDANTESDGNQPVFGGTGRHGFAASLALTTPITLTNGSTDTLSVTVDGITSGTMDLTSAIETLNGQDLAARLQSRINTDSTLVAAGKSVSVTSTDGRLVISSNSTGPTSTVEVLSGSARTLLGFNGGSGGSGGSTFAATVETDAAATNSGGASVSQGQVVNTSTTSFDNYVVRFNGSGAFDVLNISAPVTVTPNSANAGRVGTTDAGIIDPQQVTLDTYEIQFTSPSQYTVRNTTTGAILSTGNSYLSGGVIEFDGLRVVLSNGQQGGPVAGDRFTVAVAPKMVLANQTYTSGSPIVFDGIQLSITNGTAAPSAGDLFHVASRTQYVGDSGLQQIEVSDGEVVSTNVPGDQVFSGPSTNLFNVVQNLLAALRGNYTVGITQSLGGLDSAINQVSAAESTIGSIENRLQSTSSTLQDAQTTATNTLSSFEDIDLAKTISDLTLQQYAVQAAGTTLGRIFDESLLKYLPQN